MKIIDWFVEHVWFRRVVLCVLVVMVANAFEYFTGLKYSALVVSFVSGFFFGWLGLFSRIDY